MAGFSKIAALAAFTLSTLTTANELVEREYGPRTTCPCYTATTSTSNTACPTFTSLCTIPLCLYLTTSTIPGPNRRCPHTSTTTTNIPCQTACPTGCATYTSTVTARSSCLATTSSTWTPTAITDPPPPPTSTVYGKEGDRCLAFKFPPEPLCGPGLQCVLDDPQVPDIGGVCKPSTSTPMPTQTVGQEGDRCGRFSFPGDPPCGPGLQCVLDDPRIPDAGGFCRRSGYPTPTPTVGVEGDRCGRFSFPGDPPCGPGLTCVLDDPRIPDAGGYCRLDSSSTSTGPPTPTATVGAEGDRCGRFSLEGDPPCGPGLECVLEDPMIPDAGGFCRRSNSSSTAPPYPTATVGAEGDRCGRFSFPGDPPCGPGLTCVLDDPRIPDAGGYCRRSNSTSTYPPTPTPTVGAEGDRCGRFSIEGDPPCGPGLTCVLENPRVPDLGGFCRVESTTTVPPTPTPTVGAEGDKCGRFRFPMDPPCGPGLECFLTDPMIPDLGGVCKRAGAGVSSSASACVGTVTEFVTVTAY